MVVVKFPQRPAVQVEEALDPHIVLPTLDGNITVAPVSLFEAYVAGEEVLMEPLMLRSIVNAWLTQLGVPAANQAPDPDYTDEPIPANVQFLKQFTAREQETVNKGDPQSRENPMKTT